MVCAPTVHWGDLRAQWKSKALGVHGHGMLGLLVVECPISNTRVGGHSPIVVAGGCGELVWGGGEQVKRVYADSKHWSRVVLWPPVDIRLLAATSTGTCAHLFQTGRGKAFKPVESDDARRGRTTDTTARRSGAPHLTPAEWKKAVAAQIDRLQRGRARAESVAKP